jgi:hypothetical protein
METSCAGEFAGRRHDPSGSVFAHSLALALIVVKATHRRQASTAWPAAQAAD